MQCRDKLSCSIWVQQLYEPLASLAEAVHEKAMSAVDLSLSCGIIPTRLTETWFALAESRLHLQSLRVVLLEVAMLDVTNR